jgi:hypothetical protein
VPHPPRVFCERVETLTFSILSTELKQQLHCQLNHPWPAPTQPRIRLRLIRSLCNQSLIRRSRADKKIGQRKIRMIEDVEEFRPQLQVHSIGQRRVFRQSKIHVPVMRPINHVAPQSAKSPQRRIRKRAAIEITNRVGRRRPVRIDDRLPRNQVRTLVKVRWLGN